MVNMSDDIEAKQGFVSAKSDCMQYSESLGQHID